MQRFFCVLPMISFENNLKEFTRGVSDFSRNQLPFATAMALNNTGYKVLDGQKKLIKKSLDNPKPYTVNSLQIARSNRAKKNKQFVLIDLKKPRGKQNAVGKYLQWQIHGGARQAKGIELKLRGMGVMRVDEYIMPSKELRLDQYGNMSNALWKKILAGIISPNSEYFVMPRKIQRKRPKLIPGIWKRISREKIEPVVLFVKRPNYKDIIRYYEGAEKLARHHFPNELEKSFRRALETAR